MLISQLFKTNSLTKQDFKLLENWYKKSNSEREKIMREFAAAINKDEKGKKIKQLLRGKLENKKLKRTKR